ncbi:hypothetical protein CYMTET_17366 [Cymbomonas tetramitiformis]|uniref:Uncharacterized protein n=1 Tax=Cymbomonas tetramitiformis TaxID=36881 RepID=A0AAE0GAG2_9CHLO|nr:hypothetical protein CYMTET_17366 [Cymbomonas tetramitiformis]
MSGRAGASYEKGVTGDNLRDPCPGYTFDLLTGEKKPLPSKNPKAKCGMTEQAISLPIGIQGLGMSQVPSAAKTGPLTLSGKEYRENLHLHVRHKEETRERFDAPATSAQVVGFAPQPMNAPLHGRKSCQETIIEEYQILGPRHS